MSSGAHGYRPDIDGLRALVVLEARVVIEQWRHYYNELRPHSALDYVTAAHFVRNLSGHNHEALLLK